MLELFLESVAPVNLPYSILLMLVIVYWGVYALGLAGLDLGHADVDTGGDVHAGVDVHAGGDADVGAHDGGVHDIDGASSWLAGVLGFLYVGQLPLPLVASVVIIAMWTTSVVVNYSLGNRNVWIALAIALPILLVGLLAAKVLIMPVAPLLRKLFDTRGDHVPVVGRSCVIHSLEATARYGQAELSTAGAPLLLNVKTADGVTLEQGERAIIYDYDATEGVYLVAKFDRA